MMFGPAREAAEYAVAELERRADEALGRRTRLALGRYAALLVLGAPTAYVVGAILSGTMRWTLLTTQGLVAGVLLFAVVDLARFIARAARRRASPDASRASSSRADAPEEGSG
ncbi:MAG: hypothetical protein JO225_03020 [Candidatus Eremiobacteraeota bacterium]|nr:hypothetical protein [Candidatus Eremiobacteraeota bacterium]MBV8642868.1 hypothetical protein [Candidatus Eremiobacteraeota bacterium]